MLEFDFSSSSPMVLTHVWPDRLLLQPGGETVYFGDIEPHTKVLTDYFTHNGAACPEDVNPAEFMLDAISNGSHRAEVSTSRLSLKMRIHPECGF
jgi:ABC-2 type transporter